MMISGQPAITVAVSATTAPSSGPIAPEQPSPDARVASAYPTISANLPISAGSSIATLQIFVDNIDVTRDARYSGTFVTYIPRDGLNQGTHTVSIRGTASDGRPFQRSWSFETTAAPAADVAAPPAAMMPAIQLTVSGNQFIGGAPINLQMTAPPDGQAFAFVCTSAWQFPLYAAPTSPFYSGVIPTAVVGAAINCPVTAMYVARDGSVTYAPYPVFVQLLPPRTASPASTPTPRSTPVPTSTPVPVPRATPARIPVPTPVRKTPPPQAPVVHRVAVPKAHVTPSPQ